MSDSAGFSSLSDPQVRRDPLPAPPTLLFWLYVGRLCLASAIAVAIAINASSLVPGIVPSGGLIAVVVALGLGAALFTGLSSFHTHVRQRPVGFGFLYVQYLFDVALVTVVVHITGGVNSDFASLYIPIIGLAAVTMPFRSAMLIALAAAVAYFTDGVLAQPVELSFAVWLQIGVFVVVAAATGWLASRVRVVGAQRQQLAAEVQRLRLEAADILREISGGIVTVRGDGTLVFANRSAERLLEFSAAEFRNKPVLQFLSGRSPEIWAAIVGTQRDGRRRVRVEGSVMASARTFPIGVTTTMHEREGEGVPSVTAIFTDISDQRRLQELRLRTERLEAIAALSASLAHEIKNPLASIRSSVEQLGQSVRADEDDRFLAELIVRESDRLSRLLTEFLDFSRVRMTESHMIELQEIAKGAVALVREHPDCPAGAEIVHVGSPVWVKGDEDLIHRVIVNLVLNALQASQGTARVTVGVHEVPPVDLPVGVATDASVLLRVSDNGPGIPAALQRNVFEPFVTGRQGGTGLGLAIVQRAVEAHNGIVFVDSEPGIGTTFSIYLPAKGKSEVAA